MKILSLPGLSCETRLSHFHVVLLQQGYPARYKQLNASIKVSMLHLVKTCSEWNDVDGPSAFYLVPLKDTISVVECNQQSRRVSKPKALNP